MMRHGVGRATLALAVLAGAVWGPHAATAGRAGTPSPLRVPGGIFRDYHHMDLMRQDRMRNAEVIHRVKRAKVEVLATHPGHLEGPVWHQEFGALFCGDGILRVTESKRGVQVSRFLDVGASGILRRRDGHYIATDNRGHRILDLAPDRTVNVLADQWNGQPLRLTNDITMDDAGTIYWTDPAGCDNGEPNGWIMRLLPNGKVDRIATGLYYPNGIEVDPDGKWLYVVQSMRHNVLRYRIPKKEQPLPDPTEFCVLENNGVGDGLTVDLMGNVYVANLTGRQIEVFGEKGKRLATLPTPGYGPTNVTFGGRSLDDLYITADGADGRPGALLFAKLNVPGFRGFKGKPLRPLRTLDLRQPAKD